jgi:hypothetical protein
MKTRKFQTTIRFQWIIAIIIVTLCNCRADFSEKSDDKYDNLEFAPTTNAGPDQVVDLGSGVTLDGSASVDPEGEILTYTWLIYSKPTGSTATLNNSNSDLTSFTADKVGLFLVNLATSDGIYESSDSVRISAILEDATYDEATGLIWQDNNYSTTHDWQSAVDYCQNLTLANFTDWYLPSKSELINLYEHRNILNSYSREWHWSSTIRSGYHEATVVIFGTYGVNTFQYNMDSDRLVRCVRGG